jgi:hypothetical protein
LGQQPNWTKIAGEIFSISLFRRKITPRTGITE